MKVFKDRQQAGAKLAEALRKYAPVKPLILALPRGGVPVGFEISKGLNAPLDVIITRKLGTPGNKELGVGAISEGGTKILDRNMLEQTGLTEEDLGEVVKQEQSELLRRIKLYRGNRPLPEVKNKAVILVDDGLATGVTAKAAIASLKKLNPKKIIFASPVCSYGVAQELGFLVDDFVCLKVPSNVYAIGYWYEDFDQVSDEEVLGLLKQSRRFLKVKG